MSKKDHRTSRSTMSFVHHRHHYIDNRDGWELELKQCPLPPRVHKNRRPVLIIPGYGMNSFIFGFHPHGLSMEEYLRQKGFEVWSINLRSQGGSRRITHTKKYGLKELGTIDLKAAIHFITQNSVGQTGKVDVIGCSLGGTIAFVYAALVSNNRLGSIVGMGAPLRWEKVHPFLKIAFFSPRLVGMIPVSYTRALVKLLFPILLRSRLLRIYLHREMVDTRYREFMLETVEDPVRHVNREIAEWINNKDLILGGKNLTHKFRSVKNPLLCVIANGDGIVPPLTALSAHEIASSRVKETLVVGTDTLRFAHADLFVSNYSHEMVFRPVAHWLLKQY